MGGWSEGWIGIMKSFLRSSDVSTELSERVRKTNLILKLLERSSDQLTNSFLVVNSSSGSIPQPRDQGRRQYNT